MKLNPKSYKLRFFMYVIMLTVVNIVADIATGRSPLASDSQSFWRIALVVAIATLLNELLLHLWTRRYNKRQRKEMNDKYGKLFDEAGL